MYIGATSTGEIAYPMNLAELKMEEHSSFADGAALINIVNSADHTKLLPNPISAIRAMYASMSPAKCMDMVAADATRKPSPTQHLAPCRSTSLPATGERNTPERPENMSMNPISPGPMPTAPEPR